MSQNNSINYYIHNLDGQPQNMVKVVQTNNLQAHSYIVKQNTVKVIKTKSLEDNQTATGTTNKIKRSKVWSKKSAYSSCDENCKNKEPTSGFQNSAVDKKSTAHLVIKPDLNEIGYMIHRT